MPEYNPPSHDYTSYSQQTGPGSSTTASAAGQTSQYGSAPSYQDSRYDRPVTEYRPTSRQSDPGQAPAYTSSTARSRSK
ncbi:hypothetical protein [Phaeacidiphilus oryzae]|jgi:hypothetical protein|uniref:hypothetical protein n=1 Tax=Phaeacidiphilus oryzae TaxID=348818 RepID=UPI00056539D2|nr:hypothetical protein [Phaeacidiphilus oryzae]